MCAYRTFFYDNTILPPLQAMRRHFLRGAAILETLIHPIAPVFDENSHTLILGSFPSVKSREQLFFYGHPQNRFWRVLAAVLDEPVPQSIPEKRRLLLRHGIALWDVIGRCAIRGSDDASIRGAEPNDLSCILQAAPIRRIFCNGKTAHQLYTRLLEPRLGRAAEYLPSTSPANAQWNLQRLTEAWRVIAE